MRRSKVKNDVTQEYSDTLSKVGQELFSDFLSENTRLRQIYLLISSIITILLAYTLISPFESADVGGATFMFADPNVPKILAGAISVYFGIVYFICVLQDYEVYKFKTQPSFQTVRVKLMQLLDAMAGKNNAKTGGKTTQAGVSASLEIIEQEHKRELSRINAQISEMVSEKKMLESATIVSSETTQRIAYLARVIRNLRSDKTAKIEEHNTLIASLRAQDGADIVQTAREKAASLNKIFIKYRTYNAIIVFVEVFFPIALALFALYSVWRSFIER